MRYAFSEIQFCKGMLEAAQAGRPASVMLMKSHICLKTKGKIFVQSPIEANGVPQLLYVIR